MRRRAREAAAAQAATLDAIADALERIAAAIEEAVYPPPEAYPPPDAEGPS